MHDKRLEGLADNWCWSLMRLAFVPIGYLKRGLIALSTATSQRSCLRVPQ